MACWLIWPIANINEYETGGELRSWGTDGEMVLLWQLLVLWL